MNDFIKFGTCPSCDGKLVFYSSYLNQKRRSRKEHKVVKCTRCLWWYRFNLIISYVPFFERNKTQPVVVRRRDMSKKYRIKCTHCGYNFSVLTLDEVLCYSIREFVKKCPKCGTVYVVNVRYDIKSISTREYKKYHNFYFDIQWCNYYHAW